MEPVSPPPPGYAPDEAEPAAASALGAPLRDAPGAEPPGAEPPSTPRYGDVAAAPAAGPPAWLGPTTERAEIEPLGDEPIEDMESDQALDELADDQVAAVTLDPDEVEEGATATLISPRTVDAEVVPTLRPGQPVDLPEKTDEDLDAGVATEPAVFRPVRALGVWTQLSWLIVGLLAIATIAGLIVLNARLDDFRAGGSFDDVVAAKDVIDIWLRIVLGVALVAALGLTVVWWYRIYRNQAYLGEELLRPSPWLALAAWLVPIVNLVAPPVLLHRAWRRAVSDEEATQINWWIALWWICLVAFGAVVLTVGLAAGDATTVEASLDANTYAAIAYGLLIGSSLAAVGVVSSVSERQTERATHATRAGMTPALVR